MNKNMKTAVAATLIGAAFATVAAVPAFASPNYVRITGNPVAVRENAGLSAPFIRQVHQGEQFTYLAEKNDAAGVRWYQIRLSNRQTGWVTSRFSQAVNETAAQENGAVSAQNSARQVIITAATVNVRSSASLSAKKLGKTSKGKTYTYLSSQKDSSGQIWYKIQYTAGKTGWVIGKFSKIVNPAAPSAPSQTTAARQVEITAATVNVRSSASLGAKKLGKTSRGKKYTYLSSQKDSSGQIWYKIQYTAGQTGWVIGRYSKIVKNNTSGQSEKSCQVNCKTYASTDGNIRYQYPQISGLRNTAIQNYYNQLFQDRLTEDIADIVPGTMTMKCKVTFQSKERLSLLLEGGKFYDGAAHPYGYAYAVNIDLTTGETFVPSAQTDTAKAADAILEGRWTLLKGTDGITKAPIANYYKGYDKKTLQNAIAQPNVFSVRRGSSGKLTSAGTVDCRSYLDSDGKTVLILDVSHALGDYAKVKLS